MLLTFCLYNSSIIYSGVKLAALLLQKQSMQTTGNTILITGATSGIGWAFGEEFVRLGNKVIVCGRREERLKQIGEKHPSISTRVCDVANAAQREELAQWVIQNHPELNILINNAGVQLLADLTKPVDVSRIHLEVETNFIAPVHLSSLFAQHLSKQETAAIVNISSGLAFVPLAFMPVYCATKAAIHSLTLSLRYQLRKTAVKVFEIAPPAVDTELGSDRREDKTQTHGGMPVNEFMAAAMEAIANDIFEAPVGTAKDSRQKREALFEPMNSRFGY
jgi:uncharacterized oxidoreductase